MKNFFLVAGLICSLTSFAQQQDVKEMQENAKAYTRQGDYANASIILTKALEQSPQDIEIAKSLALSYYLQKQNIKALETIKPLLERQDTDDQAFQIAGAIYKGLNQVKEAEAMYKNGIKKFPKSGALYNEYGEILFSLENPAAIGQWEKGIELDPGYSGNYYNAARYYYLSTDKIWGIIYGEIFLNIESLSGRTTEIKSVLLDSYKKLFSDDLLKNLKGKNSFEQAFLQSMNKSSGIIKNGINAESLTMIRTRFVLDWFEKYATKFPFRLFEYHRHLLRDGLFPAYNQWIFGATENLMAYQSWTSAHAKEFTDFNNFQKNRIFRVPAGQYYHK